MLLVIGKGIERLLAYYITTAAFAYSIVPKDIASTIPSYLAIDLVYYLVYNIETIAL